MYVCFPLILTQRKLQLDTLFSQQQDQMLKLDVFFSYTFRLKVLLLVDCALAKLSFFCCSYIHGLDQGLNVT